LTSWKVTATLSDMENDATMTGPAGAAAQLAALEAGRAHVAERARQPWWYDPALGLVLFALLGTMSLRNTAVQLAVDAAALVALAALKRGYTRHTGFWVNGYRRGRTRRVTAVLLGVYVVVVAAGLVGERAFDLRGSMAVAGAVVGVTTAVCSRWWTTVYIRELREQA
jgi:hypothetical protein